MFQSSSAPIFRPAAGSLLRPGRGRQPITGLSMNFMLELRADGFVMLHEARTEPWGQTVARLQSPEGAIVGISFAPWMHVSK
jgi:hypothetical protein